MNVRHNEEKKSNPLIPFIGFVMILVIGGASYMIAPMAKEFLANTNYTLGALGWRILPVNFPGSWSDLLIRILVSLGLFLFIFILLMIPTMALLTEKKTLILIPEKIRVAKKKKTRRR